MTLIFSFLFLASQESSLSIVELETYFFQKPLDHSNFEFQQPQNSESRTGFLLSFLVPGLDQYLNDRSTMAVIFSGIEVGLITYAIQKNSKGDEWTKKVENYADNSDFGFNRVLYYKNIYEAVNGEGSSDPDLFDLNADENTQYQQIRQSALWDDLKSWEKEDVGDGVHSLPSKKTQQYYEMVGKYGMFYHGWQGLTDLFPNHTDLVFTEDAPPLIEKYYDKRDIMNDAYKASTFAVSMIFINHLLSGLDALIDQKRRVNISVNSDYSRLKQEILFTYDF